MKKPNSYNNNYHCTEMKELTLENAWVGEVEGSFDMYSDMVKDLTDTTTTTTATTTTTTTGKKGFMPESLNHNDLVVYDSPPSSASSLDLGDLCAVEEDGKASAHCNDLTIFRNHDDDVFLDDQDDLLDKLIEESSHRWKTSVEGLSTVTASCTSLTTLAATAESSRSRSCSRNKKLARPVLSRTSTDPTTTSRPASRTMPKAAARKLIEEQQTEIERLRSMLKEREFEREQSSFTPLQRSHSFIQRVPSVSESLAEMNQQMMSNMMASNSCYNAFLQHSQQQQQSRMRTCKSMNNLSTAASHWDHQAPTVASPPEMEFYDPILESHFEERLEPDSNIHNINNDAAPFEHIEIKVFNTEDDMYSNAYVADDLTVWSEFNNVVETRRPEAEDGALYTSSPRPPSRKKVHKHCSSSNRHRRNLSGFSCDSGSALRRD